MRKPNIIPRQGASPAYGKYRYAQECVFGVSLVSVKAASSEESLHVFPYHSHLPCWGLSGIQDSNGVLDLETT